MRYIEQNLDKKAPKPEKPRELPKAGSYSSEALMATKKILSPNKK